MGGVPLTPIVDKAQIAFRLEYFVVAKGFLYKATSCKPLSIERMKMVLASMRLPSDIYNYKDSTNGVLFVYIWETYQ